MLTSKGAAKRLDDLDIPRIGALIGVGEDEIHAVIEVEASGSGFDSQGRVKALYEPHKAYALSSGKTRDRLVAAGLAYPKWGTKPYPKDSYPRILAACEIDETIALLSTSWGLGQVMGFNHAAAGYKTPQAMVAAFAEDEEHQLEAMIRFIITNGLDDEIRRHDWRGLARGYNGSGQVEYYAGKLQAAFAKWQKIKDTPFPPAPVVIPAQPSVIKVEDLPKAPAEPESFAEVSVPVSVIAKDEPIPKAAPWWSAVVNRLLRKEP